MRTYFKVICSPTSPQVHQCHYQNGFSNLGVSSLPSAKSPEVVWWLVGEAELSLAALHTPGHLMHPCPGPGCPRPTPHAGSLLWSLACKLHLTLKLRANIASPRGSSGASGLPLTPRAQCSFSQPSSLFFANSLLAVSSPSRSEATS